MDETTEARRLDLRMLSATDGYLFLYDTDLEKPEDYALDVRQAHAETFGAHLADWRLTIRTAAAPALRNGGRRYGYHLTPVAPPVNAKLEPVS